MKNQARKKYAIDLLMITLGSLAIAIGTNVFLLPSKLSTGGISGVGIILYHLFSVPLSVTVLLLNAVLFIFGYKLPCVLKRGKYQGGFGGQLQNIAPSIPEFIVLIAPFLHEGGKRLP